MIQNKVKFILLSLFLIFSTAAYVYADTASILPPAKTTFFDQNGKPLTSGKVYFYVPGTTTFKTTWQDAAETIPNANPVVLDSAGRAIVLGSGSYRQLIRDQANNLIWDQVTSSAGIGGGSGGAVGDGNAVGVILPWSGFVAPNNYAFAYGQELNRTTYAQLLTNLTQIQNITCTSGSNILTTVADTSQLNIGAAIEAACIPASSVIVSKTSNAVAINNNALVSTTVTATFFPYGDGNGLTTFNIPDYRGVVLPGRCNMGGSSCSVISFPSYNDPNALNGKGGNQTASLTTPNLPAYTPTGGVASTFSAGAATAPIRQYASTGASDITKLSLSSNAGADAGTFSIATTGTVSSTFTGNAQGGTATPFSIIQPSKTINYIIKIVADVNLSIATCSNLTDAGTACNANTGTSGHTLGYLDTANTHSALQTFNNVSISSATLITGLPAPTNPSDAATKAYVDSVATGLNVLAQTSLATTAVLPNAPTYANGASGVGATLTAGSNTTLTVDGTAAPLTTVVLVKNQAAPAQNGIYTVTTAGSGAAAWVLTRATYFDQAAEMRGGSYTLVVNGVVNANTGWVLQANVTTVGTDPVTWVQFSSSQVISSVIPFATRATAIAAVIPTAATQLSLQGWTSANDGGAGLYSKVSTPSSVRNWHFQSSDGAWWQLTTDVVLPKQVGAIIDGTTDDTVAVQAWVDYGVTFGVNALGQQGTSVIPQTAINLPANSYVDGLGKYTLKKTTDVNVSILDCDTNNNITVKNMNLTTTAGFGSTSSNTFGATTQNYTVPSGLIGMVVGQFVQITSVTDPTQYAIATINSYSGTTLNITMNTVAGAGTFSNWYIDRYPNNGSIAPLNSALRSKTCSKVTFEGNVVTGRFYDGIDSRDGSNVYFVRNNVNGTVNRALHQAGFNTVVTNNQMLNNTVNGGLFTQYCINLSGTDTGSMQQGVVEGNVVYNCNFQGIEAGGAVTLTTISSNQVGLPTNTVAVGILVQRVPPSYIPQNMIVANNTINGSYIGIDMIDAIYFGVSGNKVSGSNICYLIVGSFAAGNAYGTVTGNTAHNCLTNGFQFSAAVANATFGHAVTGNTAIASSGVGIVTDSFTGNFAISGNVSLANTTGQYSLLGSGHISGINQ